MHLCKSVYMDTGIHIVQNRASDHSLLFADGEIATAPKYVFFNIITCKYICIHILHASI